MVAVHISWIKPWIRSYSLRPFMYRREDLRQVLQACKGLLSEKKKNKIKDWFGVFQKEIQIFREFFDTYKNVEYRFETIYKYEDTHTSVHFIDTQNSSV